MDMLGLADRSWPVLLRVMGGHAKVYRATGGRVGHRFPGAPPSLLLDHVGARTGTKRTSPLVYTVDGENLILVASKGGYPKHPAWFHNLLAHPDTTIQLGAETLPVHARVATDQERSEWWPRLVASYPGYDFFQQLAGARTIPIVLL